jgi:hypothetical protein
MACLAGMVCLAGFQLRANISACPLSSSKRADLAVGVWQIGFQSAALCFEVRYHFALSTSELTVFVDKQRWLN